MRLSPSVWLTVSPGMTAARGPRARRLALLLAFAMSVSVAGSAQDTTQDLGPLSLERLFDVQVEGAALHPQTLEDAPASVSIITSDDITKYGYRTLGEALASVRSFYTNSNRTYTTVGVRGFQLPGDYASRFLIMVNGHNMADNVLNYMLFFGHDFPIEMSLIKRIEIIRGPSSALYGSNGIFATINIMTKSPTEADPLSVTVDAGSFGEKKIQATATMDVARGAALLLSGSLFDNAGESPLFIPEFNSAATNNGQAIGMDREWGYHVFASLSWERWSATGQFSSREKIQPISWGSTVWNDQGTRTRDTRDYLEAVYARPLAGGALKWRAYYDSYQFGGRAHYPLSATDASLFEDNFTIFNGRWVGTQITDRVEVPRIGTLTLGGEGKLDVRNLQSNQDFSPTAVEYLSVSRPDRSFSLFAQDERTLSNSWTLNLGGRLDLSRYRDRLMSSRAAAIFRPSSNWTYKFLYGRGFRNPSAFELFYEDGLSAVANPQARQEKADTIEIDIGRRLGARWNLLTSQYAYRLRDFLVGTRSQNGLIQYQNIGKIQALGIEVELQGHPTPWLDALASYAIQDSKADAEGDKLGNSPAHLAKFRIGLSSGHFVLSSGMQYSSSVTTPAGAILASHYTTDITVGRPNVLPHLEVRFGVRNAYNAESYDPIALNPLVDALRQPGRTLFIELVANRSGPNANTAK